MEKSHSIVLEQMFGHSQKPKIMKLGLKTWMQFFCVLFENPWRTQCQCKKLYMRGLQALWTLQISRLETLCPTEHQVGNATLTALILEFVQELQSKNQACFYLLYQKSKTCKRH